MSTNYINPGDLKPGDEVYTTDGEEHIVEDVVGNMIVCTDGTVEIIPISAIPEVLE